MECCWSVPFVCHVVPVDGAWLVMWAVVESVALEASGRHYGRAPCLVCHWLMSCCVIPLAADGVAECMNRGPPAAEEHVSCNAWDAYVIDRRGTPGFVRCCFDG